VQQAVSSDDSGSRVDGECIACVIENRAKEVKHIVKFLSAPPSPPLCMEVRAMQPLFTLQSMQCMRFDGQVVPRSEGKCSACWQHVLWRM
jgi:hypothetical protein